MRQPVSKRSEKQLSVGRPCTWQQFLWLRRVTGSKTSELKDSYRHFGKCKKQNKKEITCKLERVHAVKRLDVFHLGPARA